MKYEWRFCSNTLQLSEFINECNEKNYEIIAMTESEYNNYTIIYKTKG